MSRVVVPAGDICDSDRLAPVTRWSPTYWLLSTHCGCGDLKIKRLTADIRGLRSAPRRMKGDRVAVGIAGDEEATERAVGERA